MTQIVLLLSDGKPVLAFTDIKRAQEMRKFLEAAKQKPTIVILPIYQD